MPGVRSDVGRQPGAARGRGDKESIKRERAACGKEPVEKANAIVYNGYRPICGPVTSEIEIPSFVAATVRNHPVGKQN